MAKSTANKVQESTGVAVPAVIRSRPKKKAKLKAVPARKMTEAELAAAAAASPKDLKQGKFEGVVARGKTVVDDEGTKGPGAIVRASKENIERLRSLGYLVDPARGQTPLGTGPRFFREDEASKGSEPK